MKFLLAAVLLFASASAYGASFYAQPRSQVVLIDADNAICSGVVVAPRTVLSAKHCELLINPRVNGKPAKPGAKSPTSDIMVFEVDIACPCAPLARAAPEVDERVIVIGFPWNTSHVQYVTEGGFQGVTSPEPPFSGDYALSAPAAPGNSGGGVFVYRNGEWQLIGILVAGAEEGGTHMTFAVPLGEIRALLLSLRD